jgi:N-methylhydantoinase B
VISITGAGGGYGDPRVRDPAEVAATVNRGWLTLKRAEEVYGVALVHAKNGVDYVVDEQRTKRLRGEAPA